MCVQFNNRGMVAMANAGPDTNKSQVRLRSLDLRADDANRIGLVFHNICEATKLGREILYFWQVSETNQSDNWRRNINQFAE